MKQKGRIMNIGELIEKLKEYNEDVEVDESVSIQYDEELNKLYL